MFQMAQNQGNTSLSRSQERALESLIVEKTIPLAAEAANVSKRSHYRWLEKNDAFKAEYLRLRKEIVGHAVVQMQKACDNAVTVAISLMNDPGTPSSTRLAAARTVLEMSLEALKMEALEERLQLLEERLEQYEVFGKQTFPNGAQAAHRRG
jgi:hypothetical protein